MTRGRTPIVIQFSLALIALLLNWQGLYAQSKQDSIKLISRSWKMVAGGNSSKSVKLPEAMQFVMTFQPNGIVEFPSNPSDKTLKWAFKGKARLMLDDSPFSILVLKPGTFVLIEQKTDKKMIMIPVEK